MSTYTTETWTIRNVAKAFNYKEASNDETDSKIVIPIFQRGLRWEAKRRRDFIDSLEKGYPFGSLLFAKQEGLNKYSVVDGLQRGSTVADYVYNPLASDNITEIDNSTLDNIREAILPGNESTTVNEEISEVILDYLHEKKQFDKVQILTLSKKLIEKFPNNQDNFILAEKIQTAFQPFIDSLKNRYNSICDSTVPIIVYTGPKELLSEIFNRINTKGIALNDYEIYAATWIPKKYVINDTEIVENVIKKYWALSDKGYEIDGFDATAMRVSKELTGFEFLFGLGKQWPQKYSCLNVSTKDNENEVNEISFEIVDACLNNTKSIATLDRRLQSLNVNLLKKRIEEAIDFVEKSIAVIGSFKGNKRKYNALHSKYQIVSLVSYTFRKMYDPDKLENKKAKWEIEEKDFEKKLLEHYVADIIANEWHDGGAAKVYSAIREEKYEDSITNTRWEQIIDGYYQNQLQNKQNDRFSNPVNADSVILNCVYVKLFSAEDHLSTKKFDIEHLATKEKMKSILKKVPGVKLPVSSIANLCYLPEDINRGKKDKTIYEAEGLSLSITEIEKKYSFTNSNDFDWINYDYGTDDGDKLVCSFQKYLDNRYTQIKKHFISMFDPEYDSNAQSNHV